jgi:hypothetical protein
MVGEHIPQPFRRYSAQVSCSFPSMSPWDMALDMAPMSLLGVTRTPRALRICLKITAQAERNTLIQLLRSIRYVLRRLAWLLLA